jgi:type I restriction enzyme S subunit
MSRVRRLPVALPPSDEQTVMVQVLDEWFAQTSWLDVTLKEAIEQVGALDQSTLAKAFRGELVHPDANDQPAGVMPERLRSGAMAGSTGSMTGESKQGGRRSGDPLDGSQARER